MTIWRTPNFKAYLHRIPFIFDSPSLPLDRPGRLAGHVIHHAVDAADFVDDARRHPRQERMLERVIVGGHAVAAGDGAQREHVIIRAAVAHHAHRAHGQQDREGLPDLVVEAGFADFVQVDGVGLAQHVELLARDLAGQADRQAGPRERVAAASWACPSASSLNNSRSGSTSLSFMRSGRPPTL